MTRLCPGVVFLDCDLLISIAGSGAACIMVSPLLLDDAHELHPGVVLRVAPHAPALPHGGGRSSALAHTRSSDDTGPHTTELKRAGAFGALHTCGAHRPAAPAAPTAPRTLRCTAPLPRPPPHSRTLLIYCYLQGVSCTGSSANLEFGLTF